MNFWRIALPALTLLPLLMAAPSKEIVELQRDVALIQDQLRTLQRAFDEKLAALTVLTQQSLDAANKANTGVAVLDGGVRDRLREHEKIVVAPVAGVGAKVDQMAGEFSGVKESMTDLLSRMSKLQQQVVDLSSAVKTMQAPPAPPPAIVAPAGAAPTAAAVPPIPAATLYQNAMKDKSGGKTDLALQEFKDYITYYSNTELAPNAQFHIGDIYYGNGDYENALQNFDLVLEKFNENNKTDDARFMKGKALLKMDERNKGVAEFRQLIRDSPRSDLATKACAEIKRLGLSCAAPAKPASKRR
ncbi:MAG: outer membrane protein assembly factor BamD [Bryobacterales bacterium]|nr:outer membrane protein assembly factor BamD [Bryobacterales bacterium]